MLANGGEVTGVIPHFMVEQNWHHTGLTELVEVEDVYKRQQGGETGKDENVTDVCELAVCKLMCHDRFQFILRQICLLYTSRCV